MGDRLAVSYGLCRRFVMVPSLSPMLRLWLLTAVLFVSYLCVVIPIPVLPLYVTGHLGLGSAWAGLSVGGAFFSTIVTRGYAGAMSDQQGAKLATVRGLIAYAVGALVSLAVCLLPSTSPWAFAVLLLGRLLVGLGESLVGVCVVTWGIGIVGHQQSGRVMALIGAAIYGAFAVGAPIGLLLYDWVGYAGVMTVSTLLPCLGLVAVLLMEGVAPMPVKNRPSFVSVVGRIWRHGMVVCLQGIGFAAIGAFLVLYFVERQWGYAALGFTAFGLGFVVVRLVFGHFPDRFGGLPVAMVSLAVETVGQFLIWGANHAWLALVGTLLTGLGCSMIFPSMGREVVRLVEPELRGSAVGGFIAFQDLAYGLTGPLAGMLAGWAGYGSPFLVGGIAAGAGFLVVIYLRLASSRASSSRLRATPQR